MKTLILRIPTVFLVIVITLSACNKESKETDEGQHPEMTEIITRANLDYLNVAFEGGDESTPFNAPADGLIDEYIARENYLNSGEKAVRNKLTRCLRSVNISEEQMPQVRRAMLAFEQRNQRIELRHREAFANLKQRMEAQRNELIRQFNAGEINRIEFQRKMAALRANFQQALTRIKESNAEDFSRSYRMLVKQLFIILSEDQWQEFSLCLLT